MFEAIHAYLWGDELFIASPAFFIILAGPSLLLFVISILCNLRDGDESRKDSDGSSRL